MSFINKKNILLVEGILKNANVNPDADTITYQS